MQFLQISLVLLEVDVQLLAFGHLADQTSVHVSKE